MLEEYVLVRLSHRTIHLLCACAASTCLAACGGASSLAPIGLSAGQVATLGILQGTIPLTDRARSWMAPDAKKTDLLYVSDLGASDVAVYTYPGGTLEGTLTGFLAPHGVCVDKHGDVFIVNAAAYEILEYSHGGTTPIKTISDAGWYPNACAVDPSSGTLAVTNSSLGSGPGNVALYKHAKGMPALLSTDTLYFYYALAYDDAGNLYVDGNTRHTNVFAFVELPSGSASFSTITLDQPIQLPGGVQWDGKDVAVGDQGVASQGSTIYEFSIRGSVGNEVGKTPLNGSKDVIQFWLDGSTIVAPDSGAQDVGFWKYPAGGKPTKTLTGFSEPVGAAVSKH